MRRAFGEVLMSAGTVALVLLALVVFDDRVRDAISRHVSTGPSAELATAEMHVRSLTSVITLVARDQSLAHSPLLIFALAAAILVVFMLRT